MSKFAIKVAPEGTALKVQVEGIIDEDVDFNQFKIAGQTHIEMNLEKLKAINSCGIREWIKWMETAQGAKIQFHQCPKVIIDQVNMVEGFLPPTASVKSFYVPYFNEDSGDEKSVLYTFGKEYDATGIKEQPKVEDNEGNLMELDVVESKYFKFLKR